MQRDPWGRPIRGARISNPWFDPPPPRPVAPPDRTRAPLGVSPSSRDARDFLPDEPAPPPPPSAPAAVPAPAPIAAVPRADSERADLRRAVADLEAAKERVARDGKRAEEAARLRLVGELLPVLDDLDRSIASGSSDAALLHGVELVRQGLERVLAGYGLERIASANERFDPAVHEAIAVAPVTDPALDGVVIDEVARGYRLGGKVQRPARVRVGQLVAP